MNFRKRAFQSSMLLASRETIVYGASLVRNVILARMLTKADFGVAATFAILISLFEFSAKLGIGRFLVRDPQAEQDDVLASAHLMQFMSGALSAVILFVVGIIWSGAVDLGNFSWTMPALAAIPLCRGLEHMDIRRFERHLRFGPAFWVETFPQVLVTVAAWPLALLFPDFRTMLILLIGKSFFSCLASHYLAEHPYRWKFQLIHVSRMLRFGWPLLASGILMFAVFQGDQLLVATFYSLSELGNYAAAATLTLAPAMFFGRVFNTIMLPLMAKVQNQSETFLLRYRQAITVLGSFSIVLTLWMMLGAKALLGLVYGAKYTEAAGILVWLCAANGFRIIRMAPSLAALAKGDSANQLISNVWRGLSLIGAGALAFTGKPLWMIAAAGVAGEICAASAAFVRLRARDHIPMRISLLPTLLLGGTIVVGFLLRQYVGAWSSLPATLLVSTAIATCCGLALIVLSPILRSEAARLWTQWVHSQWPAAAPAQPLTEESAPKPMPR